MLKDKLVDFFLEKSFWYEDESEEYKQALCSIGLDVRSDAFCFFAHAEDGPSFVTAKGELIQLAWHIINTDYEIDLRSLRAALGLPVSWFILTSFEAGGGYFYDSKNGGVFFIKLGDGFEGSDLDKMLPQWKNFEDFLRFFFDIPC